MNAYLYNNRSDNNVVVKNLVNSDQITIHMKEDCSIVNPTIYISRNINMKNKNYLYIPDCHRYYYITNITSSQQRYIVECKSDVLMSFKEQFKKNKVVVDRNQFRFSKYFNDEQVTAYQYNHIDTIPFPKTGFDENTQEFLLTVIGNSNKPAIVSPDSGGDDGGSSDKSENTTPEEYHDKPQQEKEEDDNITHVNQTDPPPAAPMIYDSIYNIITPTQYAAIATPEVNTTYFTSLNATGKTGTRNIKTTYELYAALTTAAKNNNIPYYVRRNA